MDTYQPLSLAEHDKLLLSAVRELSLAVSDPGVVVLTRDEAEALYNELPVMMKLAAGVSQ
jgi:hypothetical protein